MKLTKKLVNDKNLNYEALEYTPKWFEYQLITEELLEQQLETFRKGEDLNTEHYRYAALLKWLEGHPQISDAELHQVLEVLQADPDQIMVTSIYIKLIRFHHLTQYQLEQFFPLAVDNKSLSKILGLAR